MAISWSLRLAWIVGDDIFLDGLHALLCGLRLDQILEPRLSLLTDAGTLGHQPLALFDFITRDGIVTDESDNRLAGFFPVG